MTEAVPVHPETVPGRPEEMRWVVPPGRLAVRGHLDTAPGELGAMLGDGTIDAALAEPGAVRITLGSGHTWRADGPRVRTALVDALADPAAWRGEQDGTWSDDLDETLARAAVDLLDGATGDYIRSHGGRIDVAGVRDGVVDVHLGGACGHCPAATATLHQRIESDLRAACPGLVGVRRVGDPAPAGAPPAGVGRRLLRVVRAERRG